MGTPGLQYRVEAQKVIQKNEKERRKNRKKPMSLKENILRKKHIQGDKKSNRKKITELNNDL